MSFWRSFNGCAASARACSGPSDFGAGGAAFGQSARGEASERCSSKGAAPASRFVRNRSKPKRFFIVDSTDVSSHSLVGSGPPAAEITVPYLTQGEIINAGTRPPPRLTSDLSGWLFQPSGCE
ncbi:hypothetical protein DIPPA_13103 [Diplonema papillatum]|nr:hypothetical protein DIPPA_13103 [Diplonema papillatum]